MAFPGRRKQNDFKQDDSGTSNMYIPIRDGLGRASTQSQPAPRKLSAADVKALRQAVSFAHAIRAAVREIEQSVKFLTTSAQQDLLREVVGILGNFFPSGYGAIDKNGKVIKSSTRYRTEVLPKSPPPDVPFYFHHDTWLFISFQKNSAAGRHRPFAPGHRNWIYLYAPNLSSRTGTLARVLIHEMIHMLSHRYRSIEEKFGTKVPSKIPTIAAGALLATSSFTPLRRVMEQHFLKLVEFLNRQPHRAGRGTITQLSNAVVTNWGAHLIEEVLAFVITERATWALAQLHAQKTSIGMSQNLVPMQFLRDYFRRYWLSDPGDRAALKTRGADQVFSTMETDLMKLVGAVEKHVGP